MKEQTKFRLAAWIIFAIALIACLCLGTKARAAVNIEDIIFGAPEKVAVSEGRGMAAIGTIGGKPVSLVAGINVGPDLSDVNNEFSAYGGMRYNLFEIGPTVTFWPRGEDDTAYGVYALRFMGYDENLLGTQFFGFKTTVAGRGGGMYAFVAGLDKVIAENTYLRTTVEFRDFRDALAASHNDFNDTWVISAGPVFEF